MNTRLFMIVHRYGDNDCGVGLPADVVILGVTATHFNGYPPRDRIWHACLWGQEADQRPGHEYVDAARDLQSWIETNTREAPL